MFRRRRSGASSTLVEPRPDADEPAEGAAGRFLRGLPGLSWLEFPAPKAPLRTASVLVRGWIALPAGSHVDGVALAAGSTWVPLAMGARPDVARFHLDKTVVGFQRFVDVTGDMAGTEWRVVATVDGTEHRSPIGQGPGPDEVRQSRRVKANKLARLEGHLACPRLDEGSRCGGELVRDGNALRCRTCGSQYEATSDHYQFLSPELASVASVTDTDSVSGWGYDDIAREIIERYPDGLVLDNGSGYKSESFDNVVCLEIADYPSTDVLAVGESLPFSDATFDAVFSLAVLEHVRDPFRCAAEIARVLKPGGTMYAAVPFLQPYHGFPHHYYNMTRRGLENLFERDFTIDRSDTRDYGHPIHTLSWFLSSYAAGLPPEVAARFLDLRVVDLLGSGYEQIEQDYVTELSADAQLELASVNYLLATRR